MAVVVVAAAVAVTAAGVAAAVADIHSHIAERRAPTSARFAGQVLFALMPAARSRLRTLREIVPLNQQSAGTIPLIPSRRVNSVLTSKRLDRDPGQLKRLYGCPSF